MDIEQLLDQVEFSEEGVGGRETCPITFWLPKEHKEKYDMLQKKTRKQFGKALKEVLMHSISIKAEKAS